MNNPAYTWASDTFNNFMSELALPEGGKPIITVNCGSNLDNNGDGRQWMVYASYANTAGAWGMEFVLVQILRRMSGQRGLEAMNSAIKRSPPIFELVALVLLLTVQWAAEQELSGSISGLVTDRSGAAIPGAKVTITNNVTSSSASVTTDDAGDYAVINLARGQCVISDISRSERN